MSLAALVMLIVYVSLFGVVRNEDEGTPAHLFQLLMAGQVPIMLFLATKWLPRMPKQALAILAFQLLAALAPFSLVFVFEL